MLEKDTYIGKDGQRRDKKRRVKCYECKCTTCGIICYQFKHRMKQKNIFCSNICANHRPGYGVRIRDGYKLIMTKGREGKKYPIYELEHRMVMEKHLGRKLTNSEKVHHIDCNRLNNNLENLVVSEHKDHLKLHHKLEKIFMEFLRRGIILFDKKNKTYNINENIIRE